MARLPRLSVGGYPHHVIQRGHDRRRVFVDDDDRRHYLQTLDAVGRARSVALHAWVLMDNHVHLLLTPASDDGLPKLMQALGRTYAQHYNRRHRHTGACWDGRYHSTLVQDDRYLLTCMAYIDLNPVRAGLVARPADWRWSSHRHYVGGGGERLPTLTMHPLVFALGNTPFAREAAYADLVRQGLAAGTEQRLTDATLKGWAFGDDGFVQALAGRTTRRVQRGRPGRPRLKPPADQSVPD